MRIERVDVSAVRTARQVAHIGVLSTLEQLGSRHIAAVLHHYPENRHAFDRRHRQGDANDGGNHAEEATLGLLIRLRASRAACHTRQWRLWPGLPDHRNPQKQ